MAGILYGVQLCVVPIDKDPSYYNLTLSDLSFGLFDIVSIYFIN